MAIVLTNGRHYIAFDKKGELIKVLDVQEAQDFYSVERAVAQKKKTPGKCRSYYFIDTDIIEPETVMQKKRKKSKRKYFTAKQRTVIYRKTEGHCYLCGKFVDFNSFEIEHKVPVSKGGSDELENLWCACSDCNEIKHNIYYDDLMERVTNIFMYQMERKSSSCNKTAEWEACREEIGKII